MNQFDQKELVATEYFERVGASIVVVCALRATVPTVAKAKAIKNAVEGAITHAWPVSVLQYHPHAIIACDEAATTELSVETVKYFKELEKNNF